jgi:predicted hydrocarbon binding protein
MATDAVIDHEIDIRMAETLATTVQESARYLLPNKMGRIILMAMEEVMGRNGVVAILNLARLQSRIGNYPANNFDREFGFEELGQLLQALDEMYGPRGGRGLARRAGQACFKFGIIDFGPMLGIADLTFRILPLGMRLKVGFEVLAQIVNKYTDNLVRLGEGEEHFYWIMDRCSVCWGRKSSSPCCHLAVGVLEEGLYWVSGGKSFYIEEVSCVATGDPTCTFLIGKRPLE